MNLDTILKNKFLFLSLAGIIFTLYTVLSHRDTIHAEASRAEYAGEWKARNNRSGASVTLSGSEEYTIRYSSMACKILFTGTIYTIDIEEQHYRILRLDIDRERSECYYLNNFFAPSRFVLKLEKLDSAYAKLRLPSISDIELFMENARGSDAVKENLESMIRLLKMKSDMLARMEQVVLEYDKREESVKK